MNISIFATKIGMSQIFVNFERIPITILKIDENVVINKFFYDNSKKHTIQLGYQDIKKECISKPLLGYFNKININPKRYIKEFKISKNSFNDIKIGHNLDINNLEGYKYVSVYGISIGKGFSGVMKRHNFKGFSATHGTHEMFRHGGSIGCRTNPGRVFKGKKMPGRLGHKKTTILNIKIVKKINNKKLLLVKGSVPGHKNSILSLRCYNI